ncbi:MAG: hypothetical protein JO322_04260 [Candidatus Eremiobacteraeota bacterium]|nr:hypothetical protein [Candidatus Eremiobacteraeota bacterium]
MLLYPHSDANSDDDRLELLADPELAKRLRKANPKFFTRAGHHSIVKLLALAGIVSLVAGYVIEPVVAPPYRAPAAVVTTHVHQVPPIPVRLRVQHSVAPPVRAKPVVATAPKAAVIETEPVPQLQPKKRVQPHTRVVTVADPRVQQQNEEQFWLKAQAEARVRDRERAAKAVPVSAAPLTDQPQAPAKTTIDTGAPPKISMPGGPVSGPRAPSPVNQPFPTIPGGGPCTPGRGPILVGGHGLTGVLINAVLQNAIPIHHASFGRP